MKKELRVAALYPNTKGYGYAIFEGEGTAIGYGTERIYPLTNESCIKRMALSLAKWKPDVLILRDEFSESFKGSQRTLELQTDLRRLAQDLDIDILSFSREGVRQVFLMYGAETKYGIAKKICDWLPILREQLPTPRKYTGESEHYRQGLFDAISMVYTYYYFVNNQGVPLLMD